MSISNKPKLVARILTATVSIVFAVFIIMAFVPAFNGGLDVEKDSDFNIDINGLYLITDGNIKVTSQMPYDIDDVEINLYMNADNLTMTIIDDDVTITSGSSEYISLSGETSLLNAMLMVACYNNGSSEAGIELPLGLYLQAYYLYSMMGMQVQIDMGLDLSEEGTMSYDAVDPGLLVISTSGVESQSMISDVSPFNATVKDTQISVDLTKNGNDLTLEISTTDSDGVISELKHCAEESGGTVTVILSGTEYLLDEDQTSDMIEMLEYMYGGE